MTTRQDVLMALAKLRLNNGYAPSVRELAKELDLASPSSVHLHLRGLAEMGYITWIPGLSRTVRLTPAGVLSMVPK